MSDQMLDVPPGTAPQRPDIPPTTNPSAPEIVNVIKPDEPSDPSGQIKNAGLSESNTTGPGAGNEMGAPVNNQTLQELNSLNTMVESAMNSGASAGSSSADASSTIPSPSITTPEGSGSVEGMGESANMATGENKAGEEMLADLHAAETEVKDDAAKDGEEFGNPSLSGADTSAASDATPVTPSISASADNVTTPTASNGGESLPAGAMSVAPNEGALSPAVEISSEQSSNTPVKKGGFWGIFRRILPAAKMAGESGVAINTQQNLSDMNEHAYPIVQEMPDKPVQIDDQAQVDLADKQAMTTEPEKGPLVQTGPEPLPQPVDQKSPTGLGTEGEDSGQQLTNLVRKQTGESLVPPEDPKLPPEQSVEIPAAMRLDGGYGATTVINGTTGNVNAGENSIGNAPVLNPDNTVSGTVLGENANQSDTQTLPPETQNN